MICKKTTGNLELLERLVVNTGLMFNCILIFNKMTVEFLNLGLREDWRIRPTPNTSVRWDYFSCYCHWVLEGTRMEASVALWHASGPEGE